VSTALPERVRLVVLFGGQSAEHEVSCVSAREVIAALDPGRYDIEPVGIRHDGTWTRADATRERLAHHAELPDRLDPDGGPFDPMQELAPTEDPPTVVFPVLHGPRGEDGTVQGLLELVGVPYVGSGVLGSALAMDKAKAKEVFAHAGLPQARHLAAPVWELDVPRIAEAMDLLGPTVFVKPANMGSSVGVSKARHLDELVDGVAAAAAYDDWIVIEEAIEGRELEIGVLGNEIHRTSVVGEIIPGADFYDYDDKYVDGRAKLVIPAVIPAEIAEQAEHLARDAARAVRVEVFARVDLFYEESGRGLLLNEVNTIPGCTPVSMFPQLWSATGLPYAELLDEMVRLALDRHRRREHRGKRR
jgi:D-alanine-D-alanine ligase